MQKIFIFIAITLLAVPECGAVSAATRNARTVTAATATPTAAYNYNYMYPYMNNKMRTDLNPGVTPSQSLNPINIAVRTNSLSGTDTGRRVVPRPTIARGATSASPTIATAPTPVARAPYNDTRRVVARSGMRTAPVARTSRGDASYMANAANAAANAPESTNVPMSSARCMADYTECMNGYCVRENTAYNRCYCSAKLSQIDATYQTKIDTLIKQILTIQSNNSWSDDEMNQYWMSTVGKYHGDNSWTKLDDALNINWAGTESRVRGQQAFITGHEYCIQHLRPCYYMADNLRDAYRSSISRDCTAYEESLQRIKNAAESIVEYYR